MTTSSETSVHPPATGERFQLADHTKLACRALLADFRESTPGIRAAGLVGPDGFEVASIGAKSIAVGKVAALTSTLVAVAHAFGQEVGLPACRDVILDTDAGCSVFMAVPSPKGVYAFYAVADDGALVGRVLSQARICVQGLRAEVSAASPEPRRVTP